MTYSSYRVKVPGKLLIAGDYAVLEPKQQAIVAAVDRYLSAYIEPSKQNQVSLPQLGLHSVAWKINNRVVQFNRADARLKYIQNAIEVAHQFLQEQDISVQPFHLSIKSELNDPATGRKYGLGSSAAVVVAVISAMLVLYSPRNSQPTLEQIFKLSAIAHLRTQKNGSGVDIAASTYGGWICYTAYQPKWVLAQSQEVDQLSDLINKTWPGLSISPIQPPAQLRLCVGWTAEEASTAPLINEFKKFQVWNKTAYARFLAESSQAVTSLINSFHEGDSLGAISSLTQNRKALLMLSEEAGISIETAKLKALCQMAEETGSGKSSGAGAGDCGIAFVLGEADQVEELHRLWKTAGITPLKITVSPAGATVTEYNCEASLKEYMSS
ncbi:phosphomevalonate kinase [Bacillus sp. DNRA2]|uniref:phosphomevalonate kinase n=1 Tax=Bacillus sp. DNRA2 TaxID=2723053 RepID=UPI00145DE4FB|nr:phosphomevalonate kinase [Bacillus sp. DNRA2]NMD68681.1 phosphomevalonate kinase [Bacillus sp. DNRA2]